MSSYVLTNRSHGWLLNSLGKENHIFLHSDCCMNEGRKGEGWGGLLMLDQILVYSTAASVKARSGLGGWTGGQGKQLLFFHHFKTERLECPFKKNKLIDKTRPSFFS